ncbi:sulfatase-like hydrolase/transferase [Pseudoalteromonas sp. SR45-6]|uniref:LTA synthase family protein n=1 Tax=Pseudoalteromonas sp. SR45-6 TaxID=2760927 RepID=UPI0015FECE0D|nr:alkaline phosphatase family protein [Pseudoalteromonas sp. SR45-6]MBB1344148.1 sulfatase-like hydrolase/transferase [Pseudoalteromonas sp. SR45-6]
MFASSVAGSSRWFSFVNESWRIATLWLAGVLLFMSFRVFFLVYFHDRITTPIDLNVILNTLETGFAFDSAASGVCFSIPFLLNCILQPMRLGHWVRMVRNFTGKLFFVVAILLCITSITYIAEYGSQFNYFMFEGLHDDQQAIALTVIEQYRPWGSFLGLLALLVVAFKLCERVDKQSNSFLQRIFTDCKWKRTLLISIIVVLFICAIRGSFESRPASRKWSAVTPDPFINNLVINPFRSFFYAIKDYNDLQSHGVNGENPYLSHNSGLDALPLNALSKHTTAPLLAAPSQVFVIVMESYDSWPLQQKYAALNLTNQLKNLASKGIYLDNVLPAASSTMNSLSSIVSGIPYAGVNMSLIGPQNPSSKLSLFNQFEQLGYTSQFFYGGLLSWQNVGKYVLSQGVDKVYSAIDAGGKGSAGVWGIDDGQLFDLVAEKTTKKSFNVILSGSYHGPFNLDLDKYNYPYKSVADYPAEINKLAGELLDPYVLGHLWYADKMLGGFVAKMEQRYPDALFVITGDHYSRRNFHQRPNLYELTHVPIVIYGKGVSADLVPAQQVASHMDIAPTLLDLIAPANTQFYSMGQSLFNAAPDRRVFGFQTIRHNEQLWRGDLSALYEYYRVNERDKTQLLPATPSQFVEIDAQTEQAYTQYMATAWQLLTQGMD